MSDPRDKGKTRKGAVHKVNPTFKARQIMPMTPAQYRHYHMANIEKAARERSKASKRKWISA